MWLLKYGVRNLIHVPHLEAHGFTIDYNTKRNLVVTTPEGEKFVLKKDTSKFKGITFIEMGYQEALALFQSVSKLDTVRGNYEGFTKKDMVKSYLGLQSIGRYWKSIWKIFQRSGERKLHCIEIYTYDLHWYH